MQANWNTTSFSFQSFSLQCTLIRQQSWDEDWQHKLVLSSFDRMFFLSPQNVASVPQIGGGAGQHEVTALEAELCCWEAEGAELPTFQRNVPLDFVKPFFVLAIKSKA